MLFDPFNIILNLVFVCKLDFKTLLREILLTYLQIVGQREEIH